MQKRPIKIEKPDYSKREREQIIYNIRNEKVEEQIQKR